ncbi:anti-sigma factor [Kribbella sp. VKM Ac-2568]|uniref:anti-sigma factor n=1 Tax=Kribbella sp. VKM Ac-2568 TaxID=2512219 RepID=UPI0010F33684|nr:anti-sigma factor [Kribbella sp. VKM Ac-2568]TCM37875.1 anti-sigma-K factor RskA [Kribbella sp. VKM Ac-2568]
MDHLDPEQLARYALGDDVPLGTDEQAHLAACDTCRTEIEELRQLADLGHELRPDDRLDPAPPQVWDRVVDELGLREREPAPSSQYGGVAPRRDRRRLVFVGAVAAAVGLIAGALGARVLSSDEIAPQPQPVATTRLDPLEGKTGDGVADLIKSGGNTELRVGVNGLPAPQGFYELWLINTDGERMVSLGVLDPTTGGTFAVPPNLTSQGYRIVDVSLEPDDGKPEHSRDSVIRGTLPT